MIEFLKLLPIVVLIGFICICNYVLDGQAETSRVNMPRLRIFMCSCLAALLVVYAQAVGYFPFALLPIGIGALAGGFIGWLGWRWVKCLTFY